MKRICRIAISMLCVFGILIALPLQSRAATVEKKRIARDIAIVFDNSGSMYGQDNKRWCQATYAMEVFASMMNEGDVLRIYPMHDIKVGSSEYTLIEPFKVSKPADATKIEDIYTPKTGGTPVAAISNAYDGLSKSSAQEKWLIVLTDGTAFDEYKDKTQSGLSELFSGYVGDVNVIYLGIDVGQADVPTVATGQGSNKYKSYYPQSAMVPETLSEACNLIFGRNALPTDNINKVETDIPLSKLIVLAQGENLADITLSGGSQKLKMPLKASEKGRGNGEFIGAPELQGIIAIYEDIPIGTYDISYGGSKPADVKIYYEPDADLQVEMQDASGKTIKSFDGIEPGEYDLVYCITDSQGNDISKSKLLGTTSYSLNAKLNGADIGFKDVKESGSKKITLNGNDTLQIDSASVSFLDDYTIRKTGVELGFPAGGITTVPPDNLLELKITGGADVYEMAELEEKAAYTVKAYLNGTELSPEEFAKLSIESITVTGGEGGTDSKNPIIDSKINGNSLGVDLKYNTDAAHTNTGKQNLAVTASYVDEYEKTLTAAANKDFDIGQAVSKALAVDVSFDTDYYVLKKMGETSYAYVKVTMEGKDLTREQMQTIVDNQTIQITAKKLGLGEITPDYATSTFKVPLKKEGTEIGFRTVKAEVSMPESEQKTEIIQKAEGSGTVEISNVPRWLKILKWVLIALAIAFLIFLILNKKILPKDIYVVEDETTFRSAGKAVPDFLQIKYSSINIFERLFSRDSRLTIISTTDTFNNAITPLSIVIRPKAKVINVLTDKKRCEAIAFFSEPSSTMYGVEVGNAMFSYNKKEGKFLDDNDSPMAGSTTVIKEGSAVDIGEKAMSGRRLSYETTLHFKW